MGYATRWGIALPENFFGSANRGDHVDLSANREMAYGDPSYLACSRGVSVLMPRLALIVTGAAGMLACHGAQALAGARATTTRVDAATGVGAPSSTVSRLAPDGGEPESPGLAATAPSGGVPDASALREYDLAGHRVAVIEKDRSCFVSDRPPGSTEPPAILALGLEPPCYLLTWPHGRPTVFSDDEVPVGDVGEVMAWRYGGKAGTTVAIILGNRPSESEWQKRPKLRGLRCGMRQQALRLRGRKAEVSRRIGEGFMCLEGGADATPFWLFGHEP